MLAISHVLSAIWFELELKIPEKTKTACKTIAAAFKGIFTVSNNSNFLNSKQSFIEAIRRAGLVPPSEIIADGKVHRFSSNGKPSNKDGWYIFYADDPASGKFGCWRQGFDETWCSKTGNEPGLTAKEREELQARIKAKQEQAEKAIQEARATAQSKAQWIWNQAVEPVPDFPYLAAKSLKASYGARATKPSAKYPEPSLVIPIWIDKQLTSLQFIHADGSKHFLGGGAVTGGFFLIGEISEDIEETRIVSDASKMLFICEGFATGATIHEATGAPVFVAFNAGNLKAVAEAMRKRYPDAQIILAADDDWRTPNNPGIQKAIEAAKSIDASIVVPDFNWLERGKKETDFNDLFQLGGLELVKECLDKRRSPDDIKRLLARIGGLSIKALVEKTKSDVQILFGEKVLAELARWKREEKAFYGEFKQALKDAGLKIVRDVEEAIKALEKDASSKRKETKAKEKTFGRPEIKSTVKIGEMVDALEQAILGAGDLLFVRAGVLCRLIHGSKSEKPIKRDEGAPIIAAAPTAHILELASRCAYWTESKKVEGEFVDVACYPPRFAIDALATRGTWDFPALHGIIQAPTLRHDGSLLDKPGYDADSGLWFDPGTTVFPDIPAKPTLQDAKAAIDELLEIFQDFPFLEETDKSAALAFLLTLLCRYAIDGNVPMFLARASTPGTGKSLLVDAVSVVATGRKAARMAQEDNEDEARKRMFSLAIAGDPLVLIDNVSRPLGSAALDAAITGGVIRDRILGRSEMASAPWNAVVSASGNNLTVKGDLARRVIPIDLDARMEKPEERENFKHGDLLAWCKSNRGRLVAAGLTVLRGFIVARKPKQSIAQYGSFEQWSGLVRSSLVWCGLPDPASGRARISEASDPAIAELREALQAWRSAFGSKALSLAEVIRDIERTFAPNLGDHAQHDLMKALKEALGAFDNRFDGKRLNPKAVGRALSKHKDRIVEGLSFRQKGNGHGGTVLWKVEHAVDDYGGFGGFGGFIPIPREEKKHSKNFDHDPKDNSSIYGFYMEAAETNPPNPPNPPQKEKEAADSEEWGDA